MNVHQTVKNSCPPTQPFSLVCPFFFIYFHTFLSRIPISASLYMYVYMCHLIEVYAFAVISEYSLIILRKLPHNLVRTQGFELRCVGLNTEVANLRPGKRQTEQEETDLTQRWFHPIPSPGSCVCQQTHGKSGRKENESVKPGAATVLSFSLNRPTEPVGCSNDGWWCSEAT